MFKKFFFDYFYFRLYQLNANKGEYQWVPAIIVVSLIETLLIASLAIFFIRLNYNREITSPNAKIFSNIGIGIFIFMGIYNYIKYKDRYIELLGLWENETKTKKIVKGLIMIFIMIMSIIPLLIIGIYF